MGVAGAMRATTDVVSVVSFVRGNGRKLDAPHFFVFDCG